jgi:SAM-dependent methyltransferase
MDTGTVFPVEVAELICCPAEGHRLAIGDVVRGDATGIRDGNLRCPACAATYPLNDGVLCMFERERLHPESLHEVTTREQRAATADAAVTPWATDDDEAEFIPTLAALAPGPTDSIFELGCGDGRYTVGLVGRCRLLVALDFSETSLRVMQRRLPAGTRIGLINADVTKFKAAPRSFDKVFSTLVSNLPTRTHRDALYRLAASAVREPGLFVYSVHHYGVKERLKGVVKSGLYGPGDIYRYLLTMSETRKEIQAYFRKARIKSIQIYLPLWRRLRLPVSALSSFLEKVPLVSRWGTMLLCEASSPVQTDSTVA